MFPGLFISVFISFLRALFFCCSLQFLLSISVLYNSVLFIQGPKLNKTTCEVIIESIKWIIIKLDQL